MIVAPSTTRTSGRSKLARCLPITSSNKYFGAAGNTRPQSRPISRSMKLKNNSPRRGRTNSQIIGHTDFRWDAADFFFLGSAAFASTGLGSTGFGSTGLGSTGFASTFDDSTSAAKGYSDPDGALHIDYRFLPGVS